MTPAEIQKQRAAAYQKQRELDLRELLKQAAGRRFLWSLIEFGVAPTFSGADTHRTSYLEGRRSVATELMDELQRTAPADYVHMLSEAFSNSEAARLRLKEKADGG